VWISNILEPLGLTLMVLSIHVQMYFCEANHTIGTNCIIINHSFSHHHVKDTLCLLQNTLYPQKLALTSPTSGGHSVGIVRLRTKARELVVKYFS
jgi:hypothetical protein